MVHSKLIWTLLLCCLCSSMAKLSSSKTDKQRKLKKDDDKNDKNERKPTKFPSPLPSLAPSKVPSSTPSSLPTKRPSVQPSREPTISNTQSPSYFVEISLEPFDVVLVTSDNVLLEAAVVVMLTEQFLEESLSGSSTVDLTLDNRRKLQDQSMTLKMGGTVKYASTSTVPTKETLHSEQETALKSPEYLQALQNGANTNIASAKVELRNAQNPISAPIQSPITSPVASPDRKSVV